jgi:hypothetical protein
VAFQTPITVRKAIDCIRRNEYVLPAIQREFVWDTDQICRLFDSLMRGYPIGSFLFWKVDRERCRQYTFYKFLSDYHERDNRHNPPVDLTGDEGVTAILDGQQRLTSLYIGLRGSYASKLPHKRWNNPQAFPRRKLYLNLRSPVQDEGVELKYDLRFLTEAEAGRNGTDAFWFPVSDVLNFTNLRDINAYLRVNDLLGPEYPEQCLFTLYEVVSEKALINYYQEDSQDLGKVLNIFVRLNSGGTPLSYSDLLLSIATAQWDDVDARQAIHELVDDLNRTGEGFSFDKDFVLKSALVLADLDVGFKVENFTKDNTRKIEAAWPRISEALRMAVGLASRFGYNSFTLTATNALVPIAYYLLRRGLPQGFLERREHAEDRETIRVWLARALLKKGTFGGSLDTTLRTARTTIGAEPTRFPGDALDAAFAKIGRGVRFEDEEIEDLLDEEYGHRTTFSVLALLYPSVDFNNRFHVDHIFPRARFSPKRLRDAGVPEDHIDAFRERVDRVANLQLLEGTPNQEKSARLPAEWLRSHFATPDAQAQWKTRNYIDALPEQITEFLDFYEKRRAKMKEQLQRALGMVKDAPASSARLR